jgi:hypothetical protein
VGGERGFGLAGVAGVGYGVCRCVGVGFLDFGISDFVVATWTEECFVTRNDVETVREICY